MGYPVYKLIRAVNRQYPNNGFIDYVDVREDMTDGIIDEDLRDLINEAIHETYIDIARDEVYSFPTVPGQNQYVLPDDCDLRDIQEVTRTFGGGPRPFPPPPPPGPESEKWVIISFEPDGGTGEMPSMSAQPGDTIILPQCDFTPPSGKIFSHWEDSDGNTYDAGDEYLILLDISQTRITFNAVWENTPAPTHDYIVSFIIDEEKGHFSSGFNPHIEEKSEGDYVGTTPTVVAETGWTFDGWSTDGTTVIDEQTIENTVVQADISYIGVFSASSPTPNPGHDDVVIS